MSRRQRFLDQAEEKIRKRDLAGADKLLRRALVFDARDPRTLLLLGDAAFYRKQFGQAMSFYRDAYASLKRADVAFRIGFTLLYQRQFRQAVSFFEEALGMDPDYGPATYGLGLAYEQLGESEKAMETMNRAMGQSGEGPYPLQDPDAFMEGKPLSEAALLGSYLKAFLKRQQEKERRLTDPPARSSVAAGQALGMIRTGRLRRALELTERELLKSPGAPELLALKGRILYWLGQDQSAAETTREAVLSGLDTAETRLFLGWALFRQQRVDEAIKEIERGLQLAPEHASCAYTLGLLYQKKGEIKASYQWLEKALTLNPQIKQVVSESRGPLPPAAKREARAGCLGAAAGLLYYACLKGLLTLVSLLLAAKLFPRRTRQRLERWIEEAGLRLEQTG